MQNKELQFIQIIKNSLSDSSYLGDDCAYLRDFNLTISKDLLIEDVHFSLCTTDVKTLARKALKVNISDILASGAKPLYALVGLSGKLDRDFVSKFYSSLDECAREFELKIIGGDLTAGDKLAISITVLGDTRGRNISSRKNAKEGYILALCGEFGSSSKGLEELFKDKNSTDYFAQVHKDPKLHLKCALEISKKAQFPYAMMDSSDGLINTLEWISASSGVGFTLEYDKIPKKQGVEREKVLFGGEDYSLVCVLDERDFEKISCEDLIPVGRATIQKDILIDGKNVKEEKREEFLHFD